MTILTKERKGLPISKQLLYYPGNENEAKLTPAGADMLSEHQIEHTGLRFDRYGSSNLLFQFYQFLCFTDTLDLSDAPATTKL